MLVYVGIILYVLHDSCITVHCVCCVFQSTTTDSVSNTKHNHLTCSLYYSYFFIPLYLLPK